MLITSIIFSKDRPLQLDLCLKSIKQNFPQSTQNIVIHNNSVEFGKAHLQQKKEHPDVEFWQQTESLFCDVWDAVNEAKNDYVCFFVDDCIVYNKLFLEEINLQNLEKGVVSCISLRLGINICERSHDGHAFPDKRSPYGWLSPAVRSPRDPGAPPRHAAIGRFARGFGVADREACAPSP